ncbi:MAG: hypothetical protein CM1200mP14_25920 [Gammaproteobacteria bacterium]|nr:MAG: hypothetical protein CM1200mP14_25920 [Gammaproteobacteria bacterium]
MTEVKVFPSDTLWLLPVDTVILYPGISIPA